MSEKRVKAWDLSCADCAVLNAHQPCEACPNYRVQLIQKERVVPVEIVIQEEK